MKYAEAKRILRQSGYKFNRHLARHDEWIHARTGQRFLLSRHDGQEVPSGTLKKIERDAGISFHARPAKRKRHGKRNHRLRPH